MKSKTEKMGTVDLIPYLHCGLINFVATLRRIYEDVLFSFLEVVIFRGLSGRC